MKKNIKLYYCDSRRRNVWNVVLTWGDEDAPHSGWCYLASEEPRESAEAIAKAASAALGIPISEDE